MGKKGKTAAGRKNGMDKARSWLYAFVWMGVIFMMSAMPGEVSGEQSGRIARLLLAVISFFFGGDAAAAVSPETINLLVRKGALQTGAGVQSDCEV